LKLPALKLATDCDERFVEGWFNCAGEQFAGILMTPTASFFSSTAAE
jgi:hypothetical protein